MPTTSGKVYLLIFYFILAVFLYFLDTRGVLTFVHTIGQNVSDPVKTRLVQTKENFKALFALSKATAREERIFQLESENSALFARMANYKTLEEENVHMRRLLDADLPQNWKFSPAHVVSRLGDALFLVSDTTPELSTPVIISRQLEGEQIKGVYVGKVDEIVGSQVKVVTALDIDSKIPAIVRSKETLDRTASGILEGRGGKVVLEQVLSGETLKEGDFVFTSGELNLPSELYLGRVSKILSGSNTALQQAEVVFLLDVSKLNVVFFLTKF